MDANEKESNSRKVKLLASVDAEIDGFGKDGEEHTEKEALLPPRKGGMSRRSEKVPRKVQWNDKNGNKLAEVLEFQPSDASDSDDEESDSCICKIM